MTFFTVLAAWAGSAAAQEPTPGAPPPAPAAAPDAELPVATITGRVIDALGRPVAGAKVSVEGGTETATTDRTGTFRISAAIGASLVVERDGYDPALANVTATRLDDVVMLAAGSHAETIEISGEAPPASPGAAELDRRELQRIPGTGDDVVRALTAMPGVVNFQLPLGYSGVVIRGSSPQDSKVLVDDFEIPVLFHNIGFRALAPGRVDRSRSTTSRAGSTSPYGRASSGIVALTTRPGGDQRTTQAEVSLIDGGLLAQGPAGDQTRYMFGLRRSTIDFVLPSLIPASVDLSLTTVPSYYDEQLRDRPRAVGPRGTSTLSSDRHRRHVRAVRDQGGPEDAQGQAVLQPHAVRARSPPARSTTTVRGRPTSRCRACCPAVRVRGRPVPADRRRAARGHAARRGHPLRRSVAPGCPRSSGGPAPRPRSATRTLDLALPLERREGEPMLRRRSQGHPVTFNGLVLDPRLRGVDAR